MRDDDGCPYQLATAQQGRFYGRHTERCVLVNLRDLVLNPTMCAYKTSFSWASIGSL